MKYLIMAIFLFGCQVEPRQPCECKEVEKVKKISATFQIYDDKAGECRWRLIVNRTIRAWSSEGYKTKKGCLGSIQILKEGRYRQEKKRLIARNHKILAITKGKVPQEHIDKADITREDYGSR